MFVVDLLHEFELGVWKNTFIHLIRMLVAEGGDAIQKFNLRQVDLFYSFTFVINVRLRYRQVPTFGRSTIRRMSENTSALKQLAARNYEDFLQVCFLPSRFQQCNTY